MLLELVSKILLKLQKADPQGLKPGFWAGLGGTAEALPFPKPIFETGSKEIRFWSSRIAAGNQKNARERRPLLRSSALAWMLEFCSGL
jgi:hypothetical protein